MYRILVPTDFSSCSEHAARYAAKLAKKLDAELILLHVFFQIITTTEFPETMNYLEIEESANQSIQKLAFKLKKEYSNELKIQYLTTSGFATDEIQSLSISLHCDLIILGMNGAGFFTEKIIGNGTVSLMQKSRIPVLAIPEKAAISIPEKMVLAMDYLEFNQPTILEPLRKLAARLNARVHILHVSNDSENLIRSNHSMYGIHLANALDGIQFSTHFEKNIDVTEGINHFVHSRAMDLVAMIPRHHTFLKKLIHEPESKRFAFHADVPVFTFHDAHL